jgi:LEA14-like dessication related protein
MRKIKKWRPALLIMAMTALCTCGSLGDVAKALIQNPILKVESVKLTGINLSGVDMLCTLSVENPNAIDIPFPQIDWELFVNENAFVDGVIQNDEKLKKQSVSPVSIPFHVEYLNLFQTLKSLKGAKSADYRVALDVTFNLPVLGEKGFHFEPSGTLPLVQMPKLAGAAISIDKLDFSGIDLLCTLTVENPNVFDIPAPQMAFDYLVNSTPFIKSALVSSAPLAAGASSAIPIRFSLVYADLFKASQSLLTAGEAAGLLALTSAFAIPAFADEKQSLEVANTIPILKAPTISFKGITVKNVNLFEGLLSGSSKIDFEIGFEVENKNSFSMSLDALTYKLTVNSALWTQGSAPGKPVIGPNQKVVIPLSLSINAISLVKEIGALVASHKANVPYICEGGLTIASALPGLPPLSLPFKLTGLTKF